MWKGIEHLKTKGELATDKEEEIWEAEYRNKTRGSFEKSTDLVSELLGGCGFDEFVAAFLAKNGSDAFTKAGFPSDEGSLKLNHGAVPAPEPDHALGTGRLPGNRFPSRSESWPYRFCDSQADGQGTV